MRVIEAFSFELPLRLEVSLNSRIHWAAKARRVKAERNAIALVFPLQWRGYAQQETEARILVGLTRIAPRALDDDNLAGRFKAVRDEVAKQLGIDDGDGRIGWAYSQEKGEEAVRVSVQLLKRLGES